jgi:hypothetical protein
MKKRSSCDGELKLGQELVHQYTVTNAGSVTMTAFRVTDDHEGDIGADPASSDVPVSLAPGESFTLSKTRTISQADVDAGSVTFTAKVFGKAPLGEDAEGTDAELVKFVAEEEEQGEEEELLLDYENDILLEEDEDLDLDHEDELELDHEEEVATDQPKQPAVEKVVSSNHYAHI